MHSFDIVIKDGRLYEVKFEGKTIGVISAKIESHIEDNATIELKMFVKDCNVKEVK